MIAAAGGSTVNFLLQIGQSCEIVGPYMESYSEKRKAERISVRLRVNCRKSGVFFSDFARDICTDGISVETPAFIGKDMTVDMSFYLPDDAEPIKVAGKVVWSTVKEPRTRTDNLNAVLGIKFEGLSESQRVKLVNFINNSRNNA